MSDDNTLPGITKEVAWFIEYIKTENPQLNTFKEMMDKYEDYFIKHGDIIWIYLTDKNMQNFKKAWELNEWRIVDRG